MFIDLLMDWYVLKHVVNLIGLADVGTWIVVKTPVCLCKFNYETMISECCIK